MSYLKNKSLDTFPLSVENIKKMISGNTDNSSVFGSYMYISQMYPSDIDIIEEVEGCCDRESALKKMKKIIKRIVKDVDNKKGVYFSEMKAGKDNRYDIKLNDHFFIDKIDTLYANGLLDDQEYLVIINEHKKINNYESKLIIHEVLRQRYTIRWSLQDIKKGYIIYDGTNVKLTLMQAFNTPNMPIKIDILAPINSKYIEVTNFFILSYNNVDGENFIINVNNDMEKQLRQLIRKLSTDAFYNAYKLVKRMWVLSRLLYKKTKNEKYIKYLKRLTWILGKNYGILYQIKAELDAIRLIYERSSSIPEKLIKLQISNFKDRISYVNLGSETNNYIFKIIDNTVNNINDKQEVINNISNLMNILGKIINKFATNDLREQGFIPIPRDLT